MNTERQRIYWVWAEMLTRCRNPNHPGYKNYGGRGISVCEAWEQSFSQFETDMGQRPEGTMLDRENNDGNYEPGNCRWVSRLQQNSNRRNCIYMMDGPDKITLKEYCRRYRLSYRPIVKRIQDRGWPVDIAIASPMGARLFPRRKPK